MDSRYADSFVGRSLAGGPMGNTRRRNADSRRNSKDTDKSQGTVDRWDRPSLGTAFLC